MSSTGQLLTLLLETAASEWVIGTPFAVTAILSNQSSHAINAPADHEEPFVYGLTSLDPATPIQMRLSDNNTRRVVRPDPRPKPPPQLIPLPPGGERRFVEDVGEYLVREALAGDYELRAAYLLAAGESLVSPPVTVTLRAPAPRVTRYAGRPTVPFLSTAFLDAPPSQPATLYLREASSNGAILADEAYPVHVAEPDKIEDLAVAVSDQPAHFFRWLAWQAGDAVCSAFSQSASARVIAMPANPGLSRLRLHPTGWQYDAAEAEFAALGFDAGGEVLLATLAFAVEGGDRADVYHARTGLNAMPDSWALARLSGRGADARYLLVHANTAGNVSTIQAITVGSAVPQPRTLFTGDGAVAALSVGAWATDPVVVDLLLGPSNDDPPGMTFLRLSPDSDAPLIRRTFAAPRAAVPVAAAAWALPLAPIDRPVVMTNNDGRLLALEIEATVRTTVIDDRASSRLGLIPTGGGLWAVWLNEALGFRSALLRA